VNPHYPKATDKPLEVRLEAAELDEPWSFVGNKANQRWLWYAVDHAIYALRVPTRCWPMCSAGGRTRFSRN
jgi:IS1 transposase